MHPLNATAFDGRRYDAPPVPATASATPLLATTDASFVDLDVPSEEEPNSFGQSRTHLVHEHPGRLVATESCVTLELKCRDALLVAADEGEGEKPDPQPDARAM